MTTNVTLKALPEASRRTQNRIREHGPRFRAEKSGSVHICKMRLGLLVRSEDGWLGWLPWDELKFCAEWKLAN